MQQHIKHRLRRRTVVLLIVAAVTLLTGGTVLAQATANYDLGCRAALTSGGGTIVHGATASIGALAQFGAGQITGVSFGLRGGYIQPIPAKRAVVAAAAPALDSQQNQVFVPWLSKAGRILRGCQY